MKWNILQFNNNVIQCNVATGFFTKLQQKERVCNARQSTFVLVSP